MLSGVFHGGIMGVDPGALIPCLDYPVFQEMFPFQPRERD